MRIIAGTAKGRTLKGPKGEGLRPTSDRVRESIFNILGQWFDGLCVLDLYAGTGALGLEALSRGARRAVLVDQGREAARLCRENAQEVGLADRAEILQVSVDGRAVAAAAKGGAFDLVFADPPYAKVGPAQVLEIVAGVPQLLAPGGRVVVEHSKRVASPERVGLLERFDERRFGDTTVSFYVRPATEPPEGGAERRGEP